MTFFLVALIVVCIGLLLTNIDIPECRWCLTNEHVFPDGGIAGPWRCSQCGRFVVD